MSKKNQSAAMPKKADAITYMIYAVFGILIVCFSSVLGAALDLCVRKNGEVDMSRLESSMNKVSADKSLIFHSLTTGGYALKMLFFAVTIYGLFVLYKATETKKRLHRKGVEHGSAKWGDNAEIKALADKAKPELFPIRDSDGNRVFDENGNFVGVMIDNNIIFSKEVKLSLNSKQHTPTEDLQLKGEIENGEAKITLPEFDRTDFFTHVQGYTWGFTSDPEGKKIQYYGGKTYSFKEDTKLYRVLVKYGGGSGTKDDPYLINYYDQLELIGEEKARGYFKQTEDLWFPDYATHKPIDTINELKSDPDSEVFMYDGGNFQISNLTNPLFGQVSGAVIKNVNIANSHISSPEHKDLGFIVCNAYNYTYTSEDGKKYTTGDTVIDHCTVIDSSIYTEYTDSLAQEEAEDEEEETTDVSVEVIAPDVIEYDEKGHVIEQKIIEKEPTKKAECCVGAISGVGADIRNCYVYNFYFTNSLDDYYLYVGGLSGKPTNVLNSAICSFSAGGKIFNAGGIAGNCSGSRMYDANGKETADYYGGNIQGCAVRYPYFSTEVSCGGIVGEGGTNVKNAVISNNYCIGATFVCGVTDEKGILSKTGSIGGVIGTDGKSKYGHLITNTVSPSDFSVIGTKMLSKYDDSVRLAPYYAYFQDNIKLVINANTIAPDDPKEIYTGDFMFSDANVFGESEYGALAYPSSINDILTRIAAAYAEEEDYGE